MNKTQIVNAINDQIVRMSGFEKSRNYLSISHISGCPRRAVREYMDGFGVDENTHRMSFAGYEHEKSVLELLTRGNVIDRIGVEVVAPFDNRLRGHLDATAVDAVIEIKSLSPRKWEKLQRDKRAFWNHFVQCQMYMLYANMRHAFVIYRNRDTYEHDVIEIHFNEHKAYEFELKAKVILDAIDTGNLPTCTCGSCGG